MEGCLLRIWGRWEVFRIMSFSIFCELTARHFPFSRRGHGPFSIRVFSGTLPRVCAVPAFAVPPCSRDVAYLYVRCCWRSNASVLWWDVHCCALLCIAVQMRHIRRMPYTAPSVSTRSASSAWCALHCVPCTVSTVGLQPRCSWHQEMPCLRGLCVCDYHTVSDEPLSGR